MKKQLIRRSVWETNSSSCHSLTVDENTEIYDTIRPDENGVITITPDCDFGWNYDVYSDVYSRIAYATIYARDWGVFKDKNYLQILADVIIEHTGASEIKFEMERESRWSSTSKFMESIGSIDHQSVEDGDLEEFFNDPKYLKQFLFAPGSFIETNNDNY